MQALGVQGLVALSQRRQQQQQGLVLQAGLGVIMVL
jgi:hypothetical protein